MKTSGNELRVFLVNRDEVEQLIAAQFRGQKEHERVLSQTRTILAVVDEELKSAPAEVVAGRNWEKPVAALCRDLPGSLAEFDRLFPSMFGSYHPMVRWSAPKNLVSYRWPFDASIAPCQWNPENPPPALAVEPAQLEALAGLCHYWSRTAIPITSSLIALATLASRVDFLKRATARRNSFEQFAGKVQQTLEEASKTFKEGFWLPEALSLPWPR